MQTNRIMFLVIPVSATPGRQLARTHSIHASKLQMKQLRMRHHLSRCFACAWRLLLLLLSAIYRALVVFYVCARKKLQPRTRTPFERCKTFRSSSSTSSRSASIATNKQARSQHQQKTPAPFAGFYNDRNDCCRCSAHSRHTHKRTHVRTHARTHSATIFLIEEKHQSAPPYHRAIQMQFRLPGRRCASTRVSVPTRHFHFRQRGAPFAVATRQHICICARQTHKHAAGRNNNNVSQRIGGASPVSMMIIIIS